MHRFVEEGVDDDHAAPSICHSSRQRQPRGLLWPDGPPRAAAAAPRRPPWRTPTLPTRSDPTRPDAAPGPSLPPSSESPAPGPTPASWVYPARTRFEPAVASPGGRARCCPCLPPPWEWSASTDGPPLGPDDPGLLGARPRTRASQRAGRSADIVAFIDGSVSGRFPTNTPVRRWGPLQVEGRESDSFGESDHETANPGKLGDAKLRACPAPAEWSPGYRMTHPRGARS